MSQAEETTVRAMKKDSLVNVLFFIGECKVFPSFLQTQTVPCNSRFYDYLSLRWGKGSHWLLHCEPISDLAAENKIMVII